MNLTLKRNLSCIKVEDSKNCLSPSFKKRLLSYLRNAHRWPNIYIQLITEPHKEFWYLLHSFQGRIYTREFVSLLIHSVSYALFPRPHEKATSQGTYPEGTCFPTRGLESRPIMLCVTQLVDSKQKLSPFAFICFLYNVNPCLTPKRFLSFNNTWQNALGHKWYQKRYGPCYLALRLSFVARSPVSYALNHCSLNQETLEHD